jgi:2,4-dienoyl-CoA reductase-like NADH-dependent reductase (Old Yellow Enzyme family)
MTYVVPKITDVLKQRYQREAKGGVGLLVVEAAVVLPSRSSYNLRISDDSLTDALKGLVDAVRSANPETKIGIQIMHFLKIARSGWRQKVEDFKPEELPVIVEQHVQAARRAVTAGFDFIEVHMAHAYTLASFISRSNGRTDAYGGKLGNRMRLPAQVFEAVRTEVGNDYPVGIRINGEDFTASGSTLLQSTRVARRFARLGGRLHQRLRRQPIRGRSATAAQHAARSDVGLQRSSHESFLAVPGYDPCLFISGDSRTGARRRLQCAGGCRGKDSHAP